MSEKRTYTLSVVDASAFIHAKHIKTNKIVTKSILDFKMALRAILF